MAEATALRNNVLEYPIYGEPWTVVFPMLDADGDLVTGATTPDAEVSKNGDTFTDCTNESTEIATSSGMYYLTLTSTEMTADIVAVIAKSATSGMKTTPIVLYPRKLPQIRTGTCAGGDTGYVTLDSNAAAIDDFYNGCVVSCVIDSVREVRVITDYTGSNKQASVTPAWNTAPDSDDTFIVYSTDMRPFVTVPVSLGTQAKADVNAEVDTALADINLDHLIKVAKDTDWATTVTKESVIDLITSKNTSQTYDRASDSLEAVRDRGDAAWLTGASGAADVSYTYAGSSTGIVIGDVDAGTIAKTTIADNDPWTIGEVAGTITYPETAGGQGIRVEMTFTAGVGELPVVLNVWAQYAGGAGHQINVYMYDYVGSGWELVGNIPSGSSIQAYTFATHVTHIKNDGEMKCMFHHSDGTGVATHALSLDKVEVENQTPVTMGATLADIEGSNFIYRSATSGKNTIDNDTIALTSTVMQADLALIDGNPVTDNTATLKLKRLDIQNSTDDAVYILGDGYNGITVTATGAQNALQLSAAAGIGLNSSGLNGAVISGANGTAVTIEATGTSVNAINITGGDTSGDGISISTTDGYGIKVVSGGESNPALHLETAWGNALNLKSVDGDGIRVQTSGDGCKGVNVTAAKDNALSLRGGITTGSADAVVIQGGATDGKGISITTTDGDGVYIAASGSGKLDINAPNSDLGTTGGATADEVLDEVVEGTYTLRQMIRLMASALCGKVSGGGTTTITFRDTGDTKDRIVATVDSNGNRTAITLTET